ncbi:MAG: NAD(P)H-hydrate epimerase [Acetobacteraceae bacterium]
MFGAGLSGPVDGLAADTLAAARRILAVDVPSGVDGATGAVRAGRRRRGHGHVLPLQAGALAAAGPGACAAKWCRPIGLPSSVLAAIAPQTWANGPDLWRLPVLPDTTHKYARGYVTVLGGRP